MSEKDIEKLLRAGTAHEMASEKKYTVKELLGSQAAMNELSQERIVAVRDDLMQMINNQNGRLARQIGDISGKANAHDAHMRNELKSIADQQKKILEQLVQARDQKLGVRLRTLLKNLFERWRRLQV